MNIISSVTGISYIIIEIHTIVSLHIVSRIYGQLHKELYLDEKTMPHVYVIVSRIWARWEKSIGNEIFEKILSIRTNLLFGPSPDQSPCSRTSVICRITTYFYLLCSWSGCVHLSRDNLRWNSCIHAANWEKVVALWVHKHTRPKYLVIWARRPNDNLF